jgi:multicomponent Na+:H+ antiporter subunit F
MTASGFLDLSVNIALVMIMLGLAVAFIRLAIGPSLADRVVALDMMTISIIAFCGVFAILVDDPSFLDVAIVLALVGFLATVALARYTERRHERDEDARKEDEDA